MVLLLILNLIYPDMTVAPDTACFSLNDYAQYCGSLVDFKDTGSTVQLTVEVDSATWEFVDLLMMFNLTWDKRNAGSISGEKPVQIVMFLDFELYSRLKESGNLAAVKENFVALAKDHPMRSTKAWFATEVTEEVDLPEELKAKGTLREGFTTHWKQ